MKPEINNNDVIHQLARLKWACRRGMLELDVLLGNFLENGYAKLADDDKRLFIKLLECPDPELFAWLMGAETPADEQLIRIVGVIRAHGKSRI